MGRHNWIGDEGEQIQHDRLVIFNVGPGGRIIDKRKENVGYDFEVHKYNIYTNQMEIERHEIKTKSHRSADFPGLTPNERKAKKKYGDEYYVDEVELPMCIETYYDNFLTHD